MRLNICFVRPVSHWFLVFLVGVVGGTSVGNQSAKAQSRTNGPEVALAVSSPADEVPADTSAPQAVLPDAPAPAFEPAAAPLAGSSSLQPAISAPNLSPDSWSIDVAPNSSESVPLNQCPYDKTGARECRVHWRQLLLSSAAFNALLNAGNLYSGYYYRHETT